MNARDELARIVDEVRDDPERRDMSRIIEREHSMAGFQGFGEWDQARLVAHHLHAAGYRKPRTITTAEELDALPEDVLVEASGKYPSDGGFTNCWIRPIPSHITGGQGKRAWEVLIYLDGGAHNITHADLIKFPATVLHEPAVSQ